MTSLSLNQTETVDTNLLDWIPLERGLSFKPIRFFADDTGYQLLLRLEPGTVIPRHRHTGEIHAFNLRGWRELLDSGQIIGPGGYVHEPVGHVDSWRAVGVEACVVHIEVNGRVEYLDADDAVVRYTDCGTARAQYRQWCVARDLTPLPGLR
jgi:2,4'-dihydroxyacetophenone dioxygenase